MKNKIDVFGDRMKDYEFCYDITLPRRIPMVLRIDGKTFHAMVKKWKCVKPFDERLQKMMSLTAMELCKQISGAKLAYIQSDEITIVVYDDQDKSTEAWFNKRLNKILSISASIATREFNSLGIVNKDLLDTLNYPAIFDCRVMIMPDYEVKNNLIWRQQDASKNSKQMLARSLYSHKELNGKNGDELQEMTFQKGINWNNIETWKKRGWCIKQVLVEVESEKGKAIRNKWVEDLEIPIFTQNNYLDFLIKGQITNEQDIHSNKR